MARVYIYVKGQALHAIDEHRKGLNISRSRFLVQSAIWEIKRAGVNTSVLRCEYCKKYPSVGRYKMITYDYEFGESEKVLSLCNKCIQNAEKEGTEIQKV